MKKLFFLFIIISAFNIKVFASPEISAKYAVVYEPKTGEILYDKNASECYPMASTTKIMTCIVALTNCDISETVTVSANAARQEGSSAYLRAGDKISMENLLYGLMLNSGNDCAMAIAEHISGNCENFAVLMNETAISIGAKNTHFKNPSGLDEEGHYTTADNLAKITAYALKNEFFRELVTTKYKTIELENSTLYLANHNKLLKSYEGCIGVKTGFTKSIGRCLVSAAERDGITLIAVTLNAPNDWADHKQLLDDGFKVLENKKIIEKGQILKSQNTNGNNICFCASDDFYYPCKNNRTGDFEIVLHTAPIAGQSINKGEKIGIADILYKSKKVGTLDLISKSDITGMEYGKIQKNNSLFSIIKNKLSNLFLYLQGCNLFNIKYIM